MPTLLLIEDDELIAEPLVHTLSELGYTMLTASDGLAGLGIALTQLPDLIILDIMLPQMDGWEVCKAIRQKSVVSILILTARGHEVDRIHGLELGADDYLTKPFSTRELVARVKALLRRVEYDTSWKLQTIKPVVMGDIVIDVAHHRVLKRQKELQLRLKEFELLSLLAANLGEVVTRAEIFDKVWGTDWLGDMRTLDVHIRWLREKLEDNPSEPSYIQTVPKVGYRLAEKVSS